MRKECSVTARISPNTKQLFARWTAHYGISASSALRWLIKSALRNTTAAVKVFKQYQDEEKTDKYNAVIRTRLDDTDYKCLEALSQKLGSYPTAIARVLVRNHIEHANRHMTV